MVLSEGKGVGAGKQSTMPSPGVPGKQHPSTIPVPSPCRQTPPFHSGPRASPYIHSWGDAESHGPPLVLSS